MIGNGKTPDDPVTLEWPVSALGDIGDDGRDIVLLPGCHAEGTITTFAKGTDYVTVRCVKCLRVAVKLRLARGH